MDKTKCKLIGVNGNVFVIIACVCDALKKDGKRELAVEFREKAFKSESYDAVLRLCSEYVDID